MKLITLLIIASLLIVPIVIAGSVPKSTSSMSFTEATNGLDDDDSIPGTPGVDTGGGSSKPIISQMNYAGCWNTATTELHKTIHPYYMDDGRIWFPINEYETINLEEVAAMMVALDPICSQDFWELIRPVFIGGK